MPSWLTRLDFPLTTQVIYLDSLLGDTLSTQAVDEYGNPLPAGGLYVFRDTVPIDTVKVGDRLSVEGIHKSFSQTVSDVTVSGSRRTQKVGFSEIGIDPVEKTVSSQVGIIELDDVPASSTPPYQLNEIYPEIENVPDGLSQVIPGTTIQPVGKPYQFSNFNSANFSGGTLYITLVNHMVIYLGPVTAQLQEINGSDTTDIAGAVIQWTNEIPPGDSSQQALDLTGLSLPGNIWVKITGQTSGSNGATVVVDSAAKHSSFFLRISGSGLAVESAEAIIPSQTIDRADTIALGASENKISDAAINRGTLDITITNGLSVDANLILSIPSLQLNGVGFQQTLQLPANQTTQQTYSLNDYHMVMDLDSQKVDYSYHIETIDTDPNYVPLSSTDSVRVQIRLYGAAPDSQITFKSITGIIEPQHQTFADSIDASSSSQILEARISSGSLTLTINNTINQTSGGAPDLTLKILELFDPNGDTLAVGPQEIGPGLDSIVIQLDDFTLRLPRNNQTLHYEAVVTTPQGEVGTYNLMDSLEVQVDVSDLSFSSVTGYFDQDALVDSNTIALESATKVQEAVIQTGQIILTINNYIGVEAEASFELPEFRLNGVSLQHTLNIANTSAPQRDTLLLDGYRISLPLDDQQIHYVSRISIPNDREMTLTFGDSILVQVDISKLSFQSITGIVDPVEVTIDTIRQAISAFPEQISGLSFSQVRLTMDFDTDITIPVFLDLYLEASNDAGEKDSVVLRNWNIIDSSSIVIDATNLINLHPKEIVAYGHAQVSDGVTLGSVSQDQNLVGSLFIEAPLSFILEDTAEVKTDPTLVDFTEISKLNSITLYIDIKNGLDLGGAITALADTDSTKFDQNVPLDTLFRLEFPPDATLLDSIHLDSAKTQLFADSLYVKMKVNLLGKRDANGDPIPSRFLSSDSLWLHVYGSVTYIVNGGE